MSTPPALTFVDSKVLLYAHDDKPDARCKIAKNLVGLLWASRTGVVSTQVLQEFYFGATRIYQVAMSPCEARRAVALYAQWRLVATDAYVITAASRLEEEHSVPLRSALVVQAALRAGAAFLASADLPDLRRFGSLIVRNPFA